MKSALCTYLSANNALYSNSEISHIFDLEFRLHFIFLDDMN